MPLSGAGQAGAPRSAHRPTAADVRAPPDRSPGVRSRGRAVGMGLGMNWCHTMWLESSRDLVGDTPARSCPCCLWVCAVYGSEGRKVESRGELHPVGPDSARAARTPDRSSRIRCTMLT